jgi:very-short-patch-repair endonuclease
MVPSPPRTGEERDAIVVTARVFTVRVDKVTRSVLNQLAADQRGLFSAAQARQVGISYSQLVRGEASRHLRRVRRGVYALAGVASSSWEEILGAALAAGPDAVVSHESAAAVHGFEYADVSAIELTLPRHAHSRPPGAVVHRHADLTASDLVSKRGVLVTSQSRTLVDLAGRWGPELTEKALDEGLVQRRWTVPELQECLARARPNVPGRAFLQRLLALRAESPTADSVLEARAFRALAPLIPFETHFATVVDDRVYVIDVAWPERKVGAEIAGRAHRVTSRSAFDRERRKFTLLNAAGWKIAHLTAVMSGAEMVAAVQLLLASAAVRGSLGEKRKDKPTHRVALQGRDPRQTAVPDGDQRRR